MRQLVYQVCYARYQVSLFFCWIGSLLKYCKVPKYYDQDCSLRVRKKVCITLPEFYIENYCNNHFLKKQRNEKLKMIFKQKWFFWKVKSFFPGHQQLLEFYLLPINTEIISIILFIKVSKACGFIKKCKLKECADIFNIKVFTLEKHLQDNDTHNFTFNFARTHILKNVFRNRIIRKISKVYDSCQFSTFNLEGFHREVKAMKTHKIFPTCFRDIQECI